jgi:hypothetical protein
MDRELFRDEVENYLDIRSHSDIVNYILNLWGGERWYYH